MSVNLKALISKVNPTTRTALEAAAGLCVARTHYDMEIEHLLLQLLRKPESDFQKIVTCFALDNVRIEHGVSRGLDTLKSGNPRSPAFSSNLVRILVEAWVCSTLDYNGSEIRTGFIIVAMLNDENLSRLLYEISDEFRKIDLEKLRGQFFAIVKGSKEDPPEPGSMAASAKRLLTGGPHIFLSYRHTDGGLYAEFLYGQLNAQIPDVSIFRDDDTLIPGVLFADKITEAVKNCDALIAIIGKKWLGKEGTTRRIDSPDDWVRLEVSTALKMDKLVIPCLVGGAKLPKAEELPADLIGLRARHTVTIGQNDLRRDTTSLISGLKNWERSSTT